MQLTEEQRDAIIEAICWARDDGLPGTADHLRAILAAHNAGAQEPVAYRYRHSISEKWHYGDSPQNWWECQALYGLSQPQPTPVYYQGVMGVPPWTPPGSGSAKAGDVLTYNVAQTKPIADAAQETQEPEWCERCGYPCKCAHPQPITEAARDAQDAKRWRASASMHCFPEFCGHDEESPGGRSWYMPGRPNPPAFKTPEEVIDAEIERIEKKGETK